MARAGFIYFALVFAVGFVLGAIRVSLVVPRLGVRAAELLETPIMLLVSLLAARACLRWFGPLPATRRLMMGLLALVFMMVAELVLVAVQGVNIADYIAGRDPVSGTVYLLALLVFALMPLLVK